MTRLELLRPFFSCLWLLTVGVSCQKKTDVIVAKVATPACLLRTIDLSSPLVGGTDSYSIGNTFEYTPNRQLLKTTSATIYPGNGAVKTTEDFVYSTGKIESKMSPVPAPGQSGVVSATYTLSASGYVANITQTGRIFGSSALQTTTTTYAYDANGYLTRQTNADGSYTTYGYLNGNLATVSAYTGGNVPESTTTYTYYEDKPLTVANTTGTGTLTALEAMGLLGKASKNPIRQMVAAGVNGNRQTTDYTNTYDAAGNIVGSQQRTTSGGGAVTTGTLTYTYSCQ